MTNENVNAGAEEGNGAFAIFCFQQNPVRVRNQDGEAWFVAADVCKALTIANRHVAVARLDEDEKAIVRTGSPGRSKAMQVVSEAGLYALVLGSSRPEAKRFKQWVAHVVLPAMRRADTYILPSPLPSDMVTQMRALSRVTSDSIAALVDRAVEARITADPRVAAVHYISALDLVKQAGVPPQGRRVLVQRISRALTTYCRDHEIEPLREPTSHRRLYPLGIATEWFRKFGRDTVRKHHFERIGQAGLFDGLSLKTKRPPRMRDVQRMAVET